MKYLDLDRDMLFVSIFLCASVGRWPFSVVPVSRGCVYLPEISTKKTPQEGKLHLFVSLIYMSRFIVVWDLLPEHFTVFSFVRFFSEIILHYSSI